MIDQSRPTLFWRAMTVRRWHQNPDMVHHDDPLGAHQGRCAVLALTLWPDCSRDLLVAALTHDVPELIIGDLSGPAKAHTSGPLGDLARAYEAAEAHVRGAIGLPDLVKPIARARLKFVDRLDAYLFAELREPFLTNADDWTRARDWIIDTAAQLGVRDAVETMLYEAAR